MQTKTINSQSDLDHLLQMVIWEDSYIQNAFVLSPSYYQKDIGTVADASKPDLVVNIFCTLHKPEDISGIQLQFVAVDRLTLPVNTELSPIATFSPIGNEIVWSFHNTTDVDIRSQWLSYRILEHRELTYQEQYVIENPFLDSGARRGA